MLYVGLERKQVVQRRAIAYRERHAIADIPFALIGGVFDLRTPQAVAEQALLHPNSPALLLGRQGRGLSQGNSAPTRSIEDNGTTSTKSSWYKGWF